MKVVTLQLDLTNKQLYCGIVSETPLADGRTAQVNITIPYKDGALPANSGAMRDALLDVLKRASTAVAF